MKLKHDTVPVESGGIADQGEFRIKASSTAFAILSSGLYSNKFKAILRELGCNAYDSHVEAGHPERPFTVHLPTRLNPTLSIRDYGVGLDHEQVMGLYTTYFESTKNDSNDFVGCMGLGSKSPFSYTKNFTIVAIKDGVKGTYSAFIGSNGVPNVAQLMSEETDEESGVEITFPVEESYDMRNFKHEVADTFKWFKTKPEITGDAIEIEEIEYAERDIAPGVHLRDSQRGYHSNRSVALMGNVAYPINVPDGEELGKGVRELLHNNSFVIEVGIGELDIAASREELGYTDLTIETLKAKAEVIFGAMEGYVHDKLKPAKSKWQRVLAANKLINSNSNLFSEIVQRYVDNHPRSFPKLLKKNYYGINIELSVSEVEKAVDGMRITQKNMQIDRYGSNPTRLGTVKTDRSLKPGKKEPTNYHQRNSKDYWDVHTIYADKTVIVFNDEKGNVLARIRAACDDSDNTELDGYQNVLIVSAQNQKCDKAAMLKWIKTRLHGAPIVMASKLPSVTGQSAGATGNVSITVQQFTTKRSRSWRDEGHTFQAHYGKANELEPTTKIGKKKVWLYLPLCHKTILGPDEQQFDATQFRSTVDSCDIAKMAGIDIENVYGLNKTSIKAVTEDKRWMNFFDFIRKAFDKVDWKQARKEATARLIATEFDDNSFNPGATWADKVRLIAKNDSPAGKLFKAWVKQHDMQGALKKSGIQYDRVIIGMDRLFSDEDFEKSNAKLNVKKVSGKYEEMFKKFNETYPMLKFVSLDASHTWKEHGWNEAFDYINLVDSAS